MVCLKSKQKSEGSGLDTMDDNALKNGVWIITSKLRNVSNQYDKNKVTKNIQIKNLELSEDETSDNGKYTQSMVK